MKKNLPLTWVSRKEYVFGRPNLYFIFLDEDAKGIAEVHPASSGRWTWKTNPRQGRSEEGIAKNREEAKKEALGSLIS